MTPIWPQITLLVLMAAGIIRNIVLHGKPADPHNAVQSSIGFLLLMVLLGNGGFWKPLGW